MLTLRYYFFYYYEYYQARGAIDYLEISKEFHTVILENIPKMTLFNKTEARRFITLVDTFYDNKVCVHFFFFFNFFSIQDWNDFLLNIIVRTMGNFFN